jgi:Peptidase family U32 C-terminal domain
MSHEKRMARIEVKNRIDVGDRLTLISPNQRIDFELHTIIADPLLLDDPKSESASSSIMPENGQNRESGHGGHINLWINMPEAPEDYSIIRKKRNKA